MDEAIRDTISKLLDKAYCPDILDSPKETKTQWAWKTRGRENARCNVYTIIFKSSLLVVAGDMLNQKDAYRLGFEKRKAHAENYSNGPKWNWKIKLDKDNIVSIVNEVIEILTPKHIQEVIDRSN
jgi:hypothetical protein